jgi:UDP-N-acetyl-D-mannosaminuronate dehydrogenase
MEVTVIGLGKLGLPLAALFASAGHKVNAYDASIALIESLESESYKSSEPGLMDLLQNSKNNISSVTFKGNVTKTNAQLASLAQSVAVQTTYTWLYTQGILSSNLGITPSNIDACVSTVMTNSSLLG